MNITPIILDRLAGALSKHGVRMKRMKLLQSVAEAFGHRNVHEFEASIETDGIRPPEARYMGRSRVSNVGWMHFFQDPDGTVFAIDQHRFDAQHGRASDWILSPLGGVLDISAMREKPSEAPGHDDAPVHVAWGGEDTVFHPRITNLCEEIMMPTPYRGRIDPEVPAYMTSGCCEVATVTPEDLEHLGLRYGSFDETFYPLTDEEARYIAEDYEEADDGLHGALTGYAVLYRGAKCLMPTVEIANGPDDGFPPRDEVLRDAIVYADRIRDKVVAMGGNVLVDEDQDDRVSVMLIVPLQAAMNLGSPEKWRQRLRWLMVDPNVPSAHREPVRHQGREFAVEVSWIGEGQDSDYDPEDPDDVPLLRFDAERLVDGVWEEVPDGSYCTQVPAWCTNEQARALARMLAQRLDVEGGSHPKRLLEQLSWTDLASVKGALSAQRESDADTGADYVAHRTYGNPNQGTSIDLRRRADGSIRCEVYVDLVSVAVLEACSDKELRTWLMTLPSDIENASGPNQPSHALAPVWEDDEDPDGGVSWKLVPADESEEDWFADTPMASPFEHRFIPITEMTV